MIRREGVRNRGIERKWEIGIEKYGEILRDIAREGRELEGHPEILR